MLKLGQEMALGYGKTARHSYGSGADRQTAGIAQCNMLGTLMRKILEKFKGSFFEEIDDVVNGVARQLRIDDMVEGYCQRKTS